MPSNLQPVPVPRVGHNNGVWLENAKGKNQKSNWKVPTTTTSEGRATTYVAPLPLVLICEPGSGPGGKEGRHNEHWYCSWPRPQTYVFKCCSLGDRISAQVKQKAISQIERKGVSLGYVSSCPCIHTQNICICEMLPMQISVRLNKNYTIQTKMSFFSTRGFYGTFNNPTFMFTWQGLSEYVRTMKWLLNV